MVPCTVLHVANAVYMFFVHRQGFLMLGPELLGQGAAAKEKYLRLWTHEVGVGATFPRTGFANLQKQAARL